MKAYESEYLRATLTNDILIQTWTNLELTEEIFKNELLEFLKVFLEIKPEKLLWDNRNFNLHIPERLNQWIEKDILLPQYENGLKKITFLVPYNVLVQQTIIKSVESFKPYIKPQFFLTKKEALSYLNNDKKNDLGGNGLPNLNIENLSDNNYELRLEIDSKTLETTVIALCELNKFKEYRVSYQKTYNALTVKEKVIIRKIVYGCSSKEIGDLLNIQTDTVNTHRKNLKRKINYKNNFELLYFAKAFGIISF